MQSFVPLERDINKRIRFEEKMLEIIGLKQYHQS